MDKNSLNYHTSTCGVNANKHMDAKKYLSIRLRDDVLSHINARSLVL